MKPRITTMPSKTTALKWRCFSFEGFERIGTGYSPAEAYRKWSRFGHHYAEFPDPIAVEFADCVRNDFTVAH